MTGPVNNANFTTPVARDTRQPGSRDNAGGKPGANPAAAPGDDTLSLSSREAPAEHNSIRSADEARARLQQLTQLLATDPAGAVAAYAAIDPRSTAGALSFAA